VQSSEILLYGLMIANVPVVAAVFLWARHRGLLDDTESTVDLLFPDGLDKEEPEGGD